MMVRFHPRALHISKINIYMLSFNKFFIEDLNRMNNTSLTFSLNRAVSLLSNAIVFVGVFLLVYLVPHFIGRNVTVIEQWLLFLMVIGDGYHLLSKVNPVAKDNK